MKLYFLFSQKKKRLKKTLDVHNSPIRRSYSGRPRLLFSLLCFLIVYGVIGACLISYGLEGGQIEEAKGPGVLQLTARPDILDRNGRLLATDIKTYSLFSEPRRIIDVDETIELLSTVLPDLNWQETYNRLKRKSSFSWIQRGLTPMQKAQIMALGIPGIGFRTEIRRFYPSGSVVSHILGMVNVDNQGIAGMEKYIDDIGLSALRAAGLATEESLKPVQLSIDVRIQTIVHDELTKAMKRYKAVAAGAVILNIHTGEVLALASIPDFDPRNPVEALKSDRFNRMTAGTFEMGSIIKSFTTAMALDSDLFHLNSVIDASKPVQASHNYFIHDFHGRNRPLALWEVFIYSSNIGSAKEALAVGIEGHRDFLKRLGLLDRMTTELPEVAHPVVPHPWKNIHSMTISFGHGMATTPLQTAVGAAALMNGGWLIEPTFLKRTKEQALRYAKKVLQDKTSENMRYLYKLNSDIGSGRNAKVEGYRVGGKTGTAEKVENGKYSKIKNFNSFLAAFPIENPSYVVLTIVDEPQPEDGQRSATAAMNAGPVLANIIRRSASFLGIKPDFEKEYAPLLSTKNSSNFVKQR
ncbi:cell division protein FtsI (penicillin-binding protein 3) [Bartonella callosciuri]|uniref:Cell division protein FtsI (Penicillin-binding protein 3) n=1 Tax=Bartonella callosciuri TaxID=686223 RepID=A0A840NNN8_9HYPH|nr:penicillin-binding protein 2 [Bartonella callosciuri]MBB5073164.1 cell division protein FtsI (penicillin-binding protein 3) [Bartonella callosciuri]